MGVLGWDQLTADEHARVLDAIVANRADPSPWTVEIQPTNKCNVDCFFCSSKPFRADETLPFDDMIAPLLREGAATNLRNLRLSGGGESLVYPKIRELVDLCLELGIRITDVTTNAAPLARLARPLVEAGLDIISISLNEPDAERYAATMRTGPRVFEKVIEGVVAMREARDAAPAGRRPKIELKLMFHKGNYRLAHEMYRLGRELDADSIMINNILGLPAEQKMTATECDEARTLLGEIIAADCATGDPRLNFWLDAEGDLQAFAMETVGRLMPGRFARPEESDPPKDRVRYCLMGWYNATIAATGIVYPCCNFVGLPNKAMGNLHERSMRDVWHGPEYERFRAEFRWMMLLKGRAEHSRKVQQYLEPMCLAENVCPFSWGLCHDGFYREVAEAMDRRVSTAERLEAQARNAVLKTAHRVKATLVG
ncbi:MAG: radical SAM protein [Candidatus Sumerlaeia bacterium]|nr:radical SAM protein [Candidatus Sumerlaeia bacterium]